MMFKELLDEGYIGEIDAVRRAFESPNIAEFDGFSDRYFYAIDLATSPDLDVRGEERLDCAVAKLRECHPVISSHLGRHGLMGIYQDHMQQIEACKNGSQHTC